MAPDNARFFKSESAYQQAMALYEAMLAEITVPYEAAFVATRYGMTHVISAGPEGAPPVVLWHGSATFGPQWYHQINALAQQYRVYAPDVIGSMGKSAPTRPDRKGPAYGEWMADVLDRLPVERGHMVGVANGTWLIFKLAALAPERIASALLMGSAGFTPPRLGSVLRVMSVMLNPFQSAEGKATRILQMISPPDYQPPLHRVQLMALSISRYRIPPTPGPLRDSQLAALTAPTALLFGEYERGFNTEDVIERARAFLPNLVRVDRVPGVGNTMHVERPDVVNKLILAFLAEQLN